MKISKLPPPIAVTEQARRQFGVDFENDDIAFTYGDTVHVAEGYISPDVEVHEGIHIVQQASHPRGPAGWWEDYFKNPHFRLLQEVMAYRAQYHFISSHCKDRNRANAMLMTLAGHLSGPMYGKMISMREALLYIKGSKKEPLSPLEV